MRWLMLGCWGILALLAALPGLADEDLQRTIDTRLERAEESLQTFYRSRAYQPLWQDEASVTALVDAMASLDTDGLRVDDYLPDDPVARQAALVEDDLDARARFELETSHGLLLAMQHLARGKTDPRRMEEDWSIPLSRYMPDWAELSRALDAGDVAAALDQARPQAEHYQALRDGLAHYRAIEDAGGWPRLPESSESLREGDRHPDVALLRQRLAIERDPGQVPFDADYYEWIDVHPPESLEAPDESHRFDADLAAAVRDFQRRHLLEVDGVVGRQTRQAMNVPVESRVDQLRVNLERARWLLHDVPDEYVLVDIAGYELHHVRASGDTWRTRIVVGQPYRETPSIRSSITHLTFNPTWTIPPTIFREDKLPRIREDLDFLARENLRVLSPSGEELDPGDVDWDNPGGVMLRQAAGADNPLGHIVIRFPNDHAIYLHDTPAQWLFNRAQRAASSGCIRVEGVRELARRLLDDPQRWSTGSIASRIAEGRTGNVTLSKRVPVILSYWTASATEAGATGTNATEANVTVGSRVAFRPDIYGRDVVVRRALDESSSH